MRARDGGRAVFGVGVLSLRRLRPFAAILAALAMVRPWGIDSPERCRPSRREVSEAPALILADGEATLPRARGVDRWGRVDRSLNFRIGPTKGREGLQRMALARRPFRVNDSRQTRLGGDSRI